MSSMKNGTKHCHTRCNICYTLLNPLTLCNSSAASQRSHSSALCPVSVAEKALLLSTTPGELQEHQRIPVNSRKLPVALATGNSISMDSGDCQWTQFDWTRRLERVTSSQRSLDRCKVSIFAAFKCWLALVWGAQAWAIVKVIHNVLLPNSATKLKVVATFALPL